ncbi:MAG: hypothetical protein WAM03_00360, partial [Pseudolabrys sp.]
RGSIAFAALPIGAIGAAKAPDIGAKARSPPQIAAATNVSFILLMSISSTECALVLNAMPPDVNED